MANGTEKKKQTNLVSCLLDSRALKISSFDQPFLYNTGDVGPYIYKMQHLYGDEKSSNELLDFINKNKDRRDAFPAELFARVKEQYGSKPIFSNVVQCMAERILEAVDMKKVDCISGGERRDWFFSMIMAHLLNKPHLTIHKDLGVTTTNPNFTKTSNATDLQGANVLHITDNLVEAKTFQNYWIPAIAKANGNIRWNFAVSDRMNKGSGVLRGNGIESFSLIRINKQLFDEVLRLGYIDENQHRVLIDFIANEEESKKTLKKRYLANSKSQEDKKVVDDK